MFITSMTFAIKCIVLNCRLICAIVENEKGEA